MQVVPGCRFWQMLKDYIHRQQNRALLARINAAYADGPDPSEQMLRCKLKSQHRKISDGELVTEPRKPE